MKISEMDSEQAREALEAVEAEQAEKRERLAEIRSPKRQVVPAGETPDPLYGSGPEYRQAVESEDHEAYAAIEAERATLGSELQLLALRRQALQRRVAEARQEEATSAAPKQAAKAAKAAPDAVEAALEARTAAVEARKGAEALLRDLAAARKLAPDAPGIDADTLAAYWDLIHGRDGHGKLNIVGTLMGVPTPVGRCVADVRALVALPERAVSALEAEGLSRRAAEQAIATAYVFCIHAGEEPTVQTLAERAITRSVADRRRRPRARERVGSWLRG